MKSIIHYDRCYSWRDLNAALRLLTKEEDVDSFLKAQRIMGASPRWLRRINGRLKELRNRRERAEFEAGLKAYKGPRTKKEAVA